MPTPPRPTAARAALALLMAAALVHALVYFALLPPWMGEDEPWQVEYAHHVGTGHWPWGGERMWGPEGDKPDDRTIMSLSQLQVRRRIGGLTDAEIADTQRAILFSLAEHHFWARVAFAGWGPGSETFDQVARGFTATHQPVPYYLAAGGVLRVARALGLDGVEAELRLLRALSVLCYLGLVACAWLFAREVADDPWTPLAAALFVAWLPMHARQAAVVNNDVLAKLLAGVALVLGARVLRDRGGPGLAAALVATAFLAALTKTTAASALLVAGVALAWRLRARVGRLGGAGLAAGAVALLAGSAAALWMLSHNPVLPRRLANLKLRLAAASSGELWEKLGRTFVGTFNWETRPLPGWMYAAVGLGLTAALALALFATLRGGAGVRRRLLLLCWALVLVQLALIALRGEGRGRYFFPVLPALGALVACGVTRGLPERARPAGVGALALALVAWDAVFLWRGLVFEQYAVWGS